MKGVLLFVFLAGNIVANGQADSEKINARNTPRYGYSAAVVTYEITGDATGSSQLLFDRNGWRSVETRELRISRYGIESVEKNLELTDGDYLYNVNLTTLKGKKSTDNNWSSLLSYKEPAEVITILMESRGGKLAGTDTLLNRSCRIWSFEKGPIEALWEWQGLPLKTIRKLPGLRYEIVAVTFEELATIPQERFLLPENIVWE